MGDNLICSGEGYGGKMVCKDRTQTTPKPKCSQKGNECNYGQKCCGDNLICSGEGYGGKMVCKDRTQTTPKPKCSQKGGECSNESKCCGTLNCVDDVNGGKKTCTD